MKHLLFVVALLFCILFGSGCDKVFEFSPYSASVSFDRRNSNMENYKLIKDDSIFSPFKIALISDSHQDYNDLEDAIKHINSQNDIDFIIHGGDMSEMGLIKEYNYFYDRMKELEKPFFTTLGNHDCLANGFEIYTEMFGNQNYSFEYKECKFIFFNNVVWEMNNTEPDFKWLETELNKSANYKNVFLVAHIPTWNELFFPTTFIEFNEMMLQYGVRLTIHGHDHFAYIYSNSGIPELTVAPNMVIGAVKNGSYRILEIFNDSIHLQSVNFK